MYLLDVGPHPFNRYGTFLTRVIGAGIVPCPCRRNLAHRFKNPLGPTFFTFLFPSLLLAFVISSSGIKSREGPGDSFKVLSSCTSQMSLFWCCFFFFWKFCMSCHHVSGLLSFCLLPFFLLLPTSLTSSSTSPSSSTPPHPPLPLCIPR